MQQRRVNYEKDVRQQLETSVRWQWLGAGTGVNKTLLQARRQAGETLNPNSRQGPAPHPSYVKRT